MITLTNSLLRDYLQHLTGQRPADGTLHLLGIRSARRIDTNDPAQVAISVSNPPQPNTYDDVVGYFGPALAVYQGTVDPGRTWTLKPMRAGGCAHLCDGGPYLQRIGRHKGKPAFTQAGPVKIWRDRDRDGGQDPAEVAHWETGNGLDVHRMGAQPTVDAWSAGCLGIVAALWPEFWRRAAVSIQQVNYQLWLADGPKLGAWVDAGKPGGTI